MRVTENENLAYFDVDQTLAIWTKDDPAKTPGYFRHKRIATYCDRKVVIEQYEPHINFLKSLKSRGFYIIVHSGNGWAWAKQVVELFDLQDYVDEVKTKPAKIIDDSPYENWMPARIFIDKP